jgi:hypothetical protein
MIILLAALTGLMFAAPVVAPRIDAQCLQSPLRLGTDNIPNSNDSSTTIVDIMAFVIQPSGKPIAWVYKNRLGQQWLQTNLSEKATLKQALPSAQYARFAQQDRYLDKGSIIVRVKPLDLTDFRRSVSPLGIQPQRCFSGSVPREALGR